MKAIDTHGKDVDEILEEVITARRVGTDPKELFGGPRDWVDSIAPTIAFVIANMVGDLDTAVYVGIGAAVLALLVRVVRRESMRHAFSGIFGVLFAAGIAKLTGDADNFFLPGIITNALYGIGFLLSVAFRKPIVGVILKVFSEKPNEWHEHPMVRRAYTEVTLAWAAMFLLRFTVQEVLRRESLTGLLAIAKIAGMPLYFGVLALTFPYVKWRTRDVPVPESAEAGAEAGGEDAAGDAPEPVAEGGPA